MPHSPSNPTSRLHIIMIMILLQPLHKNVPRAHETASKKSHSLHKPHLGLPTPELAGTFMNLLATILLGTINPWVTAVTVRIQDTGFAGLRAFSLAKQGMLKRRRTYNRSECLHKLNSFIPKGTISSGP